MTLSQLKRGFCVAVPAFVFTIVWQIAASTNTRIEFLFGKPSEAARILSVRTLNGLLLTDIWATVLPMIIGFILGNLLGIGFGLLLWQFKNFNQIARPYLIALGAVPAFVFAPVLVVWFGTGIGMKVVLVFLSTVLVAASQALTGALEVDKDLFGLLHTFRATPTAVFRHLILPSAAAWVFAALRLNIGFALLGEFVGEFISSERGIAHRALVDAGLYNFSAVWVSAFVIAILATVLYLLLIPVEAILVPWKNQSKKKKDL